MINDRISINAIKNEKSNKVVKLAGWIKSKNIFKNLIILNVVDVSGEIQAIAKPENMNRDSYNKLKNLMEESCIIICGNYKSNKKEIEIHKLDVIAGATKTLSPKPRMPFDIFNEKYVDNVQSNKHIYLRNEKIVAVLKLRSKFIFATREFFEKNNFFEFTAPILTNITLYDKSTAFSIDFYDKKLYLTQCAAFYLETAVAALEKVYFICPSFRDEKSRTKKHLSEYWHLKGEIAFYNLEDMMKFVEKMLYDIAKKLEITGKEELKVLGSPLNLRQIKPPFKVVTYSEAIKILNKNGFDIEWGKSLGNDEEIFLGDYFKKPFWVKYLPRNLESFPYRINPADERTTLVADLIVPKYGEILGAAEKIYQKHELLRRMKEDFIPHPLKTYKWFVDLRDMGLPPHSGFGMGVERVLRWFLKLSHVRDAIPYPRTCSRAPYP